jgi:hypothetical protein
VNPKVGAKVIALDAGPRRQLASARSTACLHRLAVAPAKSGRACRPPPPSLSCRLTPAAKPAVAKAEAPKPATPVAKPAPVAAAPVAARQA